MIIIVLVTHTPKGWFSQFGTYPVFGYLDCSSTENIIYPIFRSLDPLFSVTLKHFLPHFSSDIYGHRKFFFLYIYLFIYQLYFIYIFLTVGALHFHCQQYTCCYCLAYMFQIGNSPHQPRPLLCLYQMIAIFTWWEHRH